MNPFFNLHKNSVVNEGSNKKWKKHFEKIGDDDESKNDVESSMILK